MLVNDAYSQWKVNRSYANYEVLGESLLPYIKRLVRRTFSSRADSEECEDIVGNAVTKVIANIESFKGESPFSIWVKVITDREGEELIRVKAHKREQSYVGNESYNPGPSMIEKIALKQLIEKLDPPERVLVQFKLEGLEESEIAEELDIPIGTVKSRWNTLTNKLRQLAG